MKRIVLVEDHPAMRHGIGCLLLSEGDFQICEEAEDAATGMAAVERANPHLVIVDLMLGEENGLDLIRGILARFPRMPVLCLSMHEESLYADRALRAGAKGYVMKKAAAETLIPAVRRVLCGGVYLSERITGAGRAARTAVRTGYWSL